MYKIINIKRESWNKKFIIVAREKGRIISWKKWTQSFNLSRAVSINPCPEDPSEWRGYCDDAARYCFIRCDKSNKDVSESEYSGVWHH